MTNIGILFCLSRYRQLKQICPNCNHKFAHTVSGVMNSLRKVDFFWINRDHKSFEWFVSLLSQLELEMAESGGGALDRFLDMHMYITSALQKTDMKSVLLQLAMDLNFEKEKRDLLTGLKSRTRAGRPDWTQLFSQIRDATTLDSHSDRKYFDNNLVEICIICCKLLSLNL